MNINMDFNGVNKQNSTEATGNYSKAAQEIKNYRSTSQANYTGAYQAMGGVNVQLGNHLPGVLDDEKTENAPSQVTSAELASNLASVDNQKNYMMVMSTTVSDEELGKIQEEGYDPGEMDPEEMVTIVDEIKMKVAESGTVVAGYNDDLDASELEAMTGSKTEANAILNSLEEYDSTTANAILNSLEEYDSTAANANLKSLEECNPTAANAILNALEEYDMPVTESNVREMNKALELAGQLSAPTDSAKSYLIANELEPTIENLYLAQHSGNTGTAHNSASYFNIGNGYLGYQTMPFTNGGAKQAAANKNNQNSNNFLRSGVQNASGNDTESIFGSGIDSQVEQIIEKAGLTVNSETKTQASWLMENDLPLTEDTMQAVSQLDAMEFPYDAAQMANAIARAMKDGQKAVQAVPGNTDTIETKVLETIDQLAKISPEAVDFVTAEGTGLNIRNLYNRQMQLQGGSGNQVGQAQLQGGSGNQVGQAQLQGGSGDQVGQMQLQGGSGNQVGQAQLQGGSGSQTGILQQSTTGGFESTNLTQAQVNARLQLEEVRLQMTLSSGSYLLKNGIKIDTTDLSQLVEDLRVVRDHMNEVNFQMGDVGENQKAADLFNETREVVAAIPSMPAKALGTTVKSYETFTLQQLYAEGQKAKQEYAIQAVEETGSGNQTENGSFQAAGQSSASMTAGKNNSFQAAGQSSALQLTNEQAAKASEQFQKYETLMTAPRADLGDSITKAFRNVDDLLRENGFEVSEENEKAARILGYNQMEITADNLNKVKDAYDQVSRVIRKMTPQATLSLIRESVNPLETGMEDLEKKLDEMQQTPEKEVEKYSRFLVRMEDSNQISEEEKQSYIGIYRMLHQIEKRDSASLGAVLNQGSELNFKNLLTSVRSQNGKGMDYSIDDKFGFLESRVEKGISITEQLSQAFAKNNAEQTVFTSEESGTEEFAKNNADQTLMQEKIQEVRSAGQVSNEAYALLSDQQIPVTVDHLLAAEGILSHRGEMFRKVQEVARKRSSLDAGNAVSGTNTMADSDGSMAAHLGMQTSILGDVISSPENELNSAMQELREHFTDADSAKAAYAEMADQMQSILEESIYTETDHINLREINAAMKQVSLAKSLSREENYEIPMQLGDELTSVNVRLIHSASEQGKMSIQTDTEKYGKVKAEFRMGSKGLDGFVVCDRMDTCEELREKSRELLQNFNQLNFAQSDRVNVNYSGQIADDNSNEQISTRELYETAKSFLTMLNS